MLQNSSKVLLTDHSDSNSYFYAQFRGGTFSMDTFGKKIALPAHKPPFPPNSSLIARKDLVLPAAFNDLSPLTRKLQPLRIEHGNEVHRFLCAFFDLSRFNAIRKMLWLIAVPGAPRSLYYHLNYTEQRVGFCTLIVASFALVMICRWHKKKI